jgi:hypothetical protein
MKLSATAVALLCLAAAYAAPTYADDPCETVLCMYGKVTGNSGGSECSSPEKAFFDIVKKNKHGFLPSHTADARKDFLLQCKAADPAAISQIISKFGRVKL